MTILKRLNTPVFYAEGVPTLDQVKDMKLTINFPEHEEILLDILRLREYEFSTIDARLTSVSGWSVRANWQGVIFKSLFDSFDINFDVDHVFMESYGGYTTCVSLKKMLYEKVLLCFMVDGDELELEYGYPFRLIIPHLWGYKSIKAVKKISFIKGYKKGFWEQRGYSDHGEIEPGITYDVNSKKKVEIPGGEVLFK
ncbi:MAG: oxidoreductase [Candidatus Muiribacterium halophilum]|uniref:Oxidoreductase n=1 Tax=Muiribacterium halophilum TaxID=2053465 RepID=A0A2N5ZB78_MUIH1|nr:MAG: oxidoreductase [Candidatus Muirbacterium halophilum]